MFEFVAVVGTPRNDLPLERPTQPYQDQQRTTRRGYSNKYVTVRDIQSIIYLDKEGGECTCSAKKCNSIENAVHPRLPSN